MKRIAIPAALLLALSSSVAFAQVALAPRYDSKALNERLTDADRALARRFQNEPFVAPDTRLKPQVSPAAK